MEAAVPTQRTIWISGQQHVLALWSLLSPSSLGTKPPMIYSVSAEGSGCERGPGISKAGNRRTGPGPPWGCGQYRRPRQNLASSPDILPGQDPSPSRHRELSQNISVGAHEQQTLL